MDEERRRLAVQRLYLLLAVAVAACAFFFFRVLEPGWIAAVLGIGIGAITFIGLSKVSTGTSRFEKLANDDRLEDFNDRTADETVLDFLGKAESTTSPEPRESVESVEKWAE